MDGLAGGCRASPWEVFTRQVPFVLCGQLAERQRAVTPSVDCSTGVGERAARGLTPTRHPPPLGGFAGRVEADPVRGPDDVRTVVQRSQRHVRTRHAIVGRVQDQLTG